ncbi:MAG TPA: M3 family oligoendopeptidase [Croceibacterium sp.]|jgi:oligoendopeptidase F
MLAFDRRGVLALSAALPFAAAAGPALAQAAAAAASSGAAWDLTDLYPDWAAWDAARKGVLAALPRLKAYKGHLGDSAEAMAKALADISDVQKTDGRVYVYAQLSADADLRVAQNEARRGQAQDMDSALSEATSWVAPEVLTLGKDKVESFIAASPVLQKRFYFELRDILRTADHTLDAQGESILAAAEAPLAGPENIRGQIVSADIPWPTVTLSDGRMQRLDDQGYTLVRDTPNRNDRKMVFEKFFTTYSEYNHSLGAAYAAKIKGDIFRAKSRKYPTTLAYALDGPNIPESVYRTLVAETDAGLPQLHRYWDLRQKMLGLPDIGYYDIYPPLVHLGRKFTLPDIRTTVLQALAPLGPDYVAELAKDTAAKWMDPLPRPGKASGAYMQGGAYDAHPYLLLNLGEDYEGMTTFAHEWGHAMHTLLAKSAQPFELYNYATFIAEIASTCNEMLLNDYMVSRAKTKEEKIFYLGQRLENLRGTFYRQTQFAEFELKAHELAEKGEGVSGEKFNQVYMDILKRYMGPKMILPGYIANEWAYIPHFFRSDFYYVYQYATSITAATWFANSILKGGKPARDNYLNVLRAGGSDYPVAILQRAGLDMTKPDPYRQLVAGFGEVIDQIEALI